MKVNMKGYILFKNLGFIKKTKKKKMPHIQFNKVIISTLQKEIVLDCFKVIVFNF